MRKILSFIFSILMVFSFAFGNVTVFGDADSDKILLTPLDTASIHTKTQIGFLSSPVDYYSYYGAGVKENSRPKAVELSWTSSIQGTFTVDISENEDLSESIVYKTSNKKINVYNLKIATQYFWQVSCGDYASKKSTFTTEGYYPRNIYVDKVSNVRDLGGYVTTDGSVLKQGLLYRGGRFNKVNAPDITIFESGAKTLVNTLGIKTEIDLRVDSELGGWTESILNTFDGLDRKVNYYICPLDPSDKKPYYYLLRDNNLDSTKQIFELLADKDNYPVYFHCSLGTDRAGELSDILHYLCSVSSDDVDYDYAFSNLAYIGSSRDYNKASRTELKKLILNYGDKVDSSSTAACLKDKLGLSDETINNIISILTDSFVNKTSTNYDNYCLSLTANTNDETSFMFDSYLFEDSEKHFLQMKVKSSKDKTIKNAIRIGTSKSKNLETDVCLDVDFSTEWQNVYIEIPSDNNTKHIKFNIPKDNKDIEFYFDDIVLLNEDKTSVKKVFNTYQHYDSDYVFVNGTDCFGERFEGVAKVVSDTPNLENSFIPQLELTMSMGAQIRLGEDNGLRFVTNVNQEQLDLLYDNGYNVEFGTLISPADYLSNPSDLTFEISSSKYIIVPYENNILKSCFRGSIVNILETSKYNPISGNLNRGFVGRGYAKIIKDDFSMIVYADLCDNIRSFSQISYLYMNDDSSDYFFLDDKLKGFIDKWASYYFE